MTTDIARLREMAEAATPGPWTMMGGELHCPSWPHWPEGERREESRAKGHITVLCWPGETPAESDVEFRNHDATLAYIAAANPQAVLALLTELETTRAQVEGMRTALLEIQRELKATLWNDPDGPLITLGIVGNIVTTSLSPTPAEKA